MPGCLNNEFIITRKFEGVNHFHYYLYRQLKGGGMEIFMLEYSEISIWKNIEKETWNDWSWQMENCITSCNDLETVLQLNSNEINSIKQSTNYLKMKISPYAVLGIANGIFSAKQFIPSYEEVISLNDINLYADVNADDVYMPVKGLVHRYPTKVLIFPSNYCGSYCRYCFRRKFVNEKEEQMGCQEFMNILNYLSAHTEINEVIFSGGDPLVINDRIIKSFLDKLAQIKTIKIVRFHTRLPIVIPYRINDYLVNMLREYKKNFAIYFVIHIDTAYELTNEVLVGISKLVDNGIMCFASTPLLKEINDDEKSLMLLWNKLIENRIKPYYLFHSDPVKGLKHFIVPLKKGLEINKKIYDKISGLAMPLYCFNVPNGGGHILLGNEYIKKIDEHNYELTNFEGKKYIYTESND